MERGGSWSAYQWESYCPLPEMAQGLCHLISPDEFAKSLAISMGYLCNVSWWKKCKYYSIIAESGSICVKLEFCKPGLP